jgi:hypothetical protein
VGEKTFWNRQLQLLLLLMSPAVVPVTRPRLDALLGSPCWSAALKGVTDGVAAAKIVAPATCPHPCCLVQSLRARVLMSAVHVELQAAAANQGATFKPPPERKHGFTGIEPPPKASYPP